MAEFNFENLAKNLPDAYKKDSSSNNYKILEIERQAGSDLRALLESIADALDIEKAAGATLDLYGKYYGQVRGRATDEQYRVMIKSKLKRVASSGSYADVVDAIAYTFGCDISEVRMVESDTTPMSVTLEKMPLGGIVKSGFNTKQAEQIIKALLPACVTLESVLFEGTFEFSDREDEYNALAGFASDTDPSIGGYLGATEADLNETLLPI